MRIGGEVLTVDVGRWRGGAQARSVVFDHDGEVTVERVDLDPLFTTVYGRRAARALRTTMKPHQPGVDRPVLWVLGTVIEARPATAPGAGGDRAPVGRPRGRGAKALGPPGAVAPLPAPRPDLAHAEVCGTA